jgi:hypothetical protein
MYREERIRSFKELRDRVRALDEDEGIRIFGRVKGFRNGGFIFLGIYVERYCVMIRDRVWDPKRGAYSVGPRRKYLYFHSMEELWEFLKGAIERPLKAWLY